MAVSLVMGNMIGSGVFLLPASLAMFGWNSVFGWVLTIAGGLCLAGGFAWLAARMPVEGGPYGYSKAAFGPLTAFMVTWSYWISNWVGVAAVAVAGVSYLGAIFPGLRAIPGAEAIAACARLGMSCKLSGLRTEQAPGQPAEELRPYVTHLVDCFSDRLMWGSDWPVLIYAGDSYHDWIETCRLLARLDPAREGWLFEGAARRFYGLEG